LIYLMTCTFATHQQEFIWQKVYHCETCGLTGRSICCEICATQCHRSLGHKTSFVGHQRAYCDCGSHTLPEGKCYSLTTNPSLPSLPVPSAPSLITERNDPTLLCTIKQTGKQYVMQDIYECETCGITRSKCAIV